MHIPSVPREVAEQIRAALKRPEGTFMFDYRFDGLFDPALGHGVLLEVATGAILFRLERDLDLHLHFIHSSPGTTTRVASVDLRPLKGSMAVKIALVWSPEETRLHVADADNPERSVVGKGSPSQRQFRIGADGAVYQVGDAGVNVMGVSVFVRGQPVLQSTALEAWNSTVEAIKVLLTGSSPSGYLFEAVCTNLTIVMLVTGFETYCKRRFLELEDEGIIADFDGLVNRFLTRAERGRGEPDVIVQDASVEGVSPARKLVDQNRIDFQNYDRCKTAFNKGYGIKFGEDIGVSNILLEELQRLIGFRHRIVHVSPLLGMLNQERVPPEEPIFPNRQYAEKALETFDDFIQGLHTATLRLRPKDSRDITTEQIRQKDYDGDE